MRPGHLRHRALAAGIAVLAGAFALSACGEKKPETQVKITPQGGPDPKLVAQVPAAIKADGKILIGVDTTYPPAEYLDTDNKTAIGFDVDLFDAVAAKLGLKTEWVTSKFDDIVPGVGSGKYEAGVSSFTINAKRLKQANMTSYFNAPIQWFTKKGNPGKIDPKAACGKKVAVQKATTEVDDLDKLTKECTAAGKPAIQVDQYQDQTAATAAVVSGKDDAGTADLPVAVYAEQQTKGQLELLGEPYGQAPYGVVTKKDQTPFAEAIAGGFKAIIADGTYQKVLDKWKLTKGAVTDSVVNPPVS